MGFESSSVDHSGNTPQEVSSPRFWYILKFWLLWGLILGVAGTGLGYVRNPDAGFVILSMIPIALGVSILGALYRYWELRRAHRRSQLW
jgi:hypothetical protein